MSHRKSDKSKLETTDPAEFQSMLKEFREIMCKKCQPLPDEPDYFTSDLILSDFLRARKYDLDAAVCMLTEAVDWRREYMPLKADCQYCHDQPGFHCIRQIGHDKCGRPILYACFAQAFATKNHSADTIVHCVQMLENARRSFKGSATQVVFVIDCTGMTLPCCNPNLAKKMMHIFADFYPERLGKAVIVNHKAIFQSIWKAIKKFLDPVTARKVVFLKNSSSSKKKKTLSEGFREFFDEATAQWLEAEIRANQDMTEAQMRFWEKPTAPNAHDPRGTEAFIREFVEARDPPNGFQPHPNITDFARGKIPRGYAVQVRRSGGGKTNTEIDERELKEYGIDSLSLTEDDDEM